MSIKEIIFEIIGSVIFCASGYVMLIGALLLRR